MRCVAVSLCRTEHCLGSHVLLVRSYKVVELHRYFLSKGHVLSRGLVKYSGGEWRYDGRYGGEGR